MRDLVRSVTELQRLIYDYDFETYSHCQKVAQLGFIIGGILRLTDEQTTLIYQASLIHDLGKIVIPKHVLNKPDTLTPEEWRIMQEHPVKGAELIKEYGGKKVSPILDMIRFHHERVDGGGYPLGLKGNDIPPEARIIALADAMDAMLTYRPYRVHIKSIKEVFREIRANAGLQFDQYFVSRILQWFNYAPNQLINKRGVGERVHSVS
ncbi:MAG: HD-GYP domain-containing protein [Chitinophagales bacterium]